MKKLLLISLILLLLVSLTACYDERGYAYKHLNDYEPGKVHAPYTGNDSVLQNDSESTPIGGTYEYLSKRGCASRPHCCGDFTPQEIWYHELEIRADVERNPTLCDQLPVEDLVVDCSGEDSYVYHSKTRCLANFE
jgi:hypothetical protein